MSKALFMAAAAGAGGVAKTYVDDVFSTWLYAGNGSTQTITNGIDLAGQGGMVWFKSRTTSGFNHWLTDTSRGGAYPVNTDTTSAQTDFSGTPTFIMNFGSSGFVTPAYGQAAQSGDNYASWTFRKAPKFFDVVKYTGNGANRTIAHSLGVAPGCILIKRTDTASNWYVYHRSISNTSALQLNSTAGEITGATGVWNSQTATAATFSIGADAAVNANGGTYVAYLFAHDPDAVDGIIQCGMVDASTSPRVSLGWEPQWLLAKRVSAVGDWALIDTMRGFTANAGNQAGLFANSSSSESTFVAENISGTGFSLAGNGGGTFIYIAIRRPNKPPTTGTQVYAPQVTSAAVDASNPRVLPIPASDLWMDANRNGVTSYTASRLTGWNYLLTQTTDADNTSYSWRQETQTLLNPQSGWWSAGISQIVHHFKRAPGFFDVVAYTGDGAVAPSSQLVPHSLGVAPQLIFIKSRSSPQTWFVYFGNPAKYLLLAQNVGQQSDTSIWNNTAATSGNFSVALGALGVNGPGQKIIAYLFATLPGISKVGSYTGNGTSQTINCGFTTGARFILIKRTDSTGDWYVWDTARGIIAANDPHLSLNTTAAEVTTDDSVDPDSTGFIVNQVAATNINVNAATYIFLAIA